jgi:hypothetical protein
VVLDHLAATAEHSPQGIAWWTRPEWLPAETREEFPSGYHNLGIAHGQPGVISFLGAVLAADAADAAGTANAANTAGPEIRSLLCGAVSWLSANKLPPGERSVFPARIDPLSAPGPTRLSWCYGDLGIATALLAAARRTGDDAWEEEALDLARAAAARTTELAETKDACLCHGSIGIAHLFNRMFQATGEPALNAAARFWLERTFATRRTGEGIAGFPYWGLGAHAELGWQADPGFLNGAAGIGLGLLAAVSPVEPAWDRALLIDVPRARRPKGDRSPDGDVQKGESK